MIFWQIKLLKKDFDNFIVNSLVKHKLFNNHGYYTNFLKDATIDSFIMAFFVGIITRVMDEAPFKLAVLILPSFSYIMFSLYKKEIIFNYSSKDFSQEFNIFDLFKGSISLVYLKSFFLFKFFHLNQALTDYYQYLNNRFNDKYYLESMEESHYQNMKCFNYHFLIDSGIKPFLKTFFQRSEKTLIKFYEERLKNHKKNLQENFIFYSFLIPKKSSISVDALKTILTNNQFPNNIVLAFKGLDFNDVLYKNYRIDDAFVNYSEENIKKIFTKYYNYNTLVEIIKLIYKNEIIIPVFSSIDEIYFFLLEVDEEIGLGKFKLNQHEKEPNLSKLDSTVFTVNGTDYSFDVFRDMSDLYDWGSALHNCLETDSRHYKNKVLNKEFYLVGIHKNKKKFAAMAITGSGNIIEIKSKLNNNLSRIEYTQIKSIIEVTLGHKN